MRDQIQVVKETLLDVLFPKQCVECGRWGSFLCLNCRNQMEYLQEQYCPRCGKRSVLGFTHQRCYRSPLDQLYSLCYYRGVVRTLINEFKFEPTIKGVHEVIDLTLQLSSLQEECPWWGASIIVPVPLHPWRQRMRGFNQSLLIAETLSHKLGIPVQPDLLKRKRYTQPQSSLRRDQRRSNVRDVFELNVKSLPKEEIDVLLVDDVFTTGNTFIECAKVLKSSGRIKNVYGFSFARG